jgi:hypothetical protein
MELSPRLISSKDYVSPSNRPLSNQGTRARQRHDGRTSRRLRVGPADHNANLSRELSPSSTTGYSNTKAKPSAGSALSHGGQVCRLVALLEKLDL